MTGSPTTIGETDLRQVLGALALEVPAEGALRIVGGAPAWYRHLGRSAPDRPERALPFLASFAEEARELLWRGEADGELRSGFWTEVTETGEAVHLCALAVRSGPLRVLLVERDEESFRDRQELVQRGRELHLAQERQLKELDRKEVLVHTLVHDLGGPLSSILGSLELLEELGLPERHQALVAAAHRAAEQQNALIDQVVRAFTAERRSMEEFGRTSQTAPDVERAARQAVELLAPAAARREIGLQISTEGRGGFQAVGEQSHLLRIFTNLVENALRHSPRGSMVLVRLVGGAQDVHASVEDEGSGVPENLVPHLFEQLVPGGSGRGGLGLYFCHATVRLWGGEIGYQPRAGRGACFWWRLPRPVT